MHFRASWGYFHLLESSLARKKEAKKYAQGSPCVCTIGSWVQEGRFISFLLSSSGRLQNTKNGVFLQSEGPRRASPRDSVLAPLPIKPSHPPFRNCSINCYPNATPGLDPKGTDRNTGLWQDSPKCSLGKPPFLELLTPSRTHSPQRGDCSLQKGSLRPRRLTDGCPGRKEVTGVVSVYVASGCTQPWLCDSRVPSGQVGQGPTFPLRLVFLFKHKHAFSEWRGPRALDAPAGETGERAPSWPGRGKTKLMAKKPPHDSTPPEPEGPGVPSP